MRITVYSKPKCVQCKMTKDWLEKNAIEYEAVDVSQDPQALEALKAHGYMGVPVTFVNTNGDTKDETHWYGFRPDMLEEFTTTTKAA